MHPSRSGAGHRLSCSQLFQKLLHPSYFGSDSGTSSEWRTPGTSSLKPPENPIGRMITKNGRWSEDNPKPWHFFGCFFLLSLLEIRAASKKPQAGECIFAGFSWRGHEGSLQHPWPVVHMDQLHSAAWSIIKDVLIMSSLLMCNIKKWGFFPFILINALPTSLISFPCKAVYFPIIPPAAQTVIIQVTGCDRETTSSASQC